MPLFDDRREARVHALVLGERIDLRTLETSHRLAAGPLVLPAGSRGCAALFPFGVAVLFDLDAAEEAELLQGLARFVRLPVERRETEETLLRVDPAAAESVEAGVVLVREITLERLQIVADILAKSVVLARYEAGIATAFDQVEPLADSLWRRGSAGHGGKALLRHLGGILRVQHQMVGRAAVAEKPDVLWDRPELERFFARLEDEYEIRERHAALEGKLDLIARTAQTLIDLLQNERSLRVEWYIVALIVIEILLTLYTMLAR